MKKLFEIPIYALSSDELKKRSDRHISNWCEKNCIVDRSEEIVRRCIEIQFFPQKVWNYNHIVGYIVIVATNDDIEFDTYFPYKNKKYCWWTKQKTLVMKSICNDAHFRVENYYSNEKIQKMISNKLQCIIEEYINKNMFVDKVAFDNLNTHIDYKSIIANAGGHD